ncbi:hypothetical protein ACWPKO_03100 [Coraliomargarita sp. W4R53]
MNVTIQQRRWSFSSKYEIHTKDDTYYAEKKIFSFADRIRIFSQNGSVLAKIKSHLFIFKPRYDFELFNSKVYQFICRKVWKGVFTCASGEDQYVLYTHKGRDYSVFRKKKQVAAFSKEKLTIGKGDTYHLQIDDNENLLVIICIALAMDSSDSENSNDQTVTIDFGNIGTEEQAFDRNWKPNLSELSTPFARPSLTAL